MDSVFCKTWMKNYRADVDHMKHKTNDAGLKALGPKRGCWKERWISNEKWKLIDDRKAALLFFNFLMAARILCTVISSIHLSSLLVGTEWISCSVVGFGQLRTASKWCLHCFTCSSCVERVFPLEYHPLSAFLTFVWRSINPSQSARMSWSHQPRLQLLLHSLCTPGTPYSRYTCLSFCNSFSLVSPFPGIDHWLCGWKIALLQLYFHSSTGWTNV